MEVKGYNWNTIINLGELFSDEGKIVEVEDKMKKAINIMIYSMRFGEKPRYTYRGIESVIKSIVVNCVQESDGKWIIEDELTLKAMILADARLQSEKYIMD